MASHFLAVVRGGFYRKGVFSLLRCCLAQSSFALSYQCFVFEVNSGQMNYDIWLFSCWVLNDYKSVAPTSMGMKSFERLVLT